MSELVGRAVAFAMRAHRGQRRKYSGEPYVSHCLDVLAGAVKLELPETALAAAVLHDTIEDTDTTYEDLAREFGRPVADLVLELTDHFTPLAYPTWNRRKRKRAEADRLASCSMAAKLIKRCDIASNISSIQAHDPGFGRVYAAEAEYLLSRIAS